VARWFFTPGCKWRANVLIGDCHERVHSTPTGARRSEIVALRWSDVDSANRTVAISRGVVTGPDGLVEKDTKSHAAVESLSTRALLSCLQTMQHTCRPTPRHAGSRLRTRRSCSRTVPPLMSWAGRGRSRAHQRTIKIRTGVSQTKLLGCLYRGA